MKCQHCKEKYVNTYEVCPACGYPKKKSENKLFLKRMIIVLSLFCAVEFVLILNDFFHFF